MKHGKQNGYINIGFIAVLIAILISGSYFILNKPHVGDISIKFENVTYYPVEQLPYNKGIFIVASTRENKECSPFVGATCYAFYKQGTKISNLGEIADYSSVEERSSKLFIYTMFSEGLGSTARLLGVDKAGASLKEEVRYDYIGMYIPEGLKDDVKRQCPEYETFEIGIYTMTKPNLVLNLVQCGKDRIMITDEKEVYITKNLDEPSPFYDESVFTSTKKILTKNQESSGESYFYISTKYVIVDPDVKNVQIVSKL